jgi:hypothetical protein
MPQKVFLNLNFFITLASDGGGQRRRTLLDRHAHALHFRRKHLPDPLRREHGLSRYCFYWAKHITVENGIPSRIIFRSFPKCMYLCISYLCRLLRYQSIDYTMTTLPILHCYLLSILRNNSVATELPISMLECLIRSYTCMYLITCYMCYQLPVCT